MSHIGIRELEKGERPYERCARLGAESLSDAELLAIILRTGSVGEDSVSLARRILALNSAKDGVLGLLHLSLPELMKIRGIGRVKGIQLLCIGELSKRIWRKEALLDLTSFQNPKAIADYYMEEMRHMEQENLKLMLLNSKNVLQKEILLSKGTVNSCVVTPREIFVEALRHQAVNIILVHNHPSGDPSPSRDDIKLTKRVEEAGTLIGIRLIDHIIIGNHQYVSLRERGMI